MRTFLCLGIVLGLVGVGLASAEEKVGQGVIEALQTKSEVFVVIALVEPPSMRASQIDLPTLRSEIASLQNQVLSTLAPSDFDVLHRYEVIPGLTGWVTKAGLAKLVANPNVVRVDLDVGGTGNLTESVPLIRADDLHILGITGDNVVVAVLDTGVDSDHADLADDILQDDQECFLQARSTTGCGTCTCPNGTGRQSGSGAAESGLDHGVMTTGIITSRGTISSVGVAPDAKILAIKVLDNTPPSGIFVFSDLMAALNFIINNRRDVKVINMSLGSKDLFAGACDNANATNIMLAGAINTLRANGVITFAASGNDGSGTHMASPACLSNVVSVGAVYDDNVGSFISSTCTDPTTAADQVACFTNSNASLDLMAPGAIITSTGRNNGTATGSGTSFASPHAAGCAALLLEAEPTLTPAQLEGLLKASPIQVTNPKNGLTFPRIDCFAAFTLTCFGEFPTTGCTVNGVPDQLCLGTDDNDTILGTSGDDVIIGLGRNDIIRGFGGNDIICGNAGNDDLFGGTGDDTISGGGGNDLIVGGAGHDTLYGDADNDTLQGNAGNDDLFGGTGDDALDGGTGNNLLDGGDGTDRCRLGPTLVSCER